MSNITLFKIENIDIDNGQAIVRFINKYGPIHTNKKTIDDFMVEVEVPGDQIDKNGKRIPKKEKVLTTENPNDDLIYSIDIPIDETGNYINEQKLIEHIAFQYPTEYFSNYLKKQNAPKNLNLRSLIGKQYEVTVDYPEFDSLGMLKNSDSNSSINII